MKKVNWTNRDWAWVVSILVGFIILILTIRLGDNKDVINLFSFVSSSVSIALAVVAIFIALKQDSDGKQVHDRLVDLLTRIQSDVKIVDAKLDPKIISSVGEETAQVYTRSIEQKETYTKEDVDKIINNISKDMSKDIALNISDIINEENAMYLSKNDKKQDLGTIEKMVILDMIKNNPDKNLSEIRDMAERRFQRAYSLATIARIMSVANIGNAS